MGPKSLYLKPGELSKDVTMGPLIYYLPTPIIPAQNKVAMPARDSGDCSLNTWMAHGCQTVPAIVNTCQLSSIQMFII